jgi:ribosomal protein S8
MLTNYICNFVSIIHYAIITKRQYCRILCTKVGLRLVSLLFKNGYLLSYRLVMNQTKKYIYIQLKNVTHLLNPLHNIKLISRPSNVVYWTVEKLNKELTRGGRLTHYILYTDKGLIFSNTALSLNVGGHVLFKIN